MRYISIGILLVFCLTLLLFTGCMINTVTPEIDNGNLENQTVEEPAIEESATAKVDTTKPVITGSRAPLPNSSGWNNTDVTVSFSCEDVGPIQSGIETNTVAGMIVTTEGKDQSVTNTGTCIDVAGNVADPVTVSGINIDKTPPVVTITLPKNGKYVLNDSVTATWFATDALSGVEDSKAPKTIKINTKSKGKKKITLPAGLVKDEAGNSSEEVTTFYEVLEADTTNEVSEADTTKPVITGSRTPLPNSFGWNNIDVTVSFSCEDVGSVQSGIETNTVAGKTVTTEGKDQSVTNTGTCIDTAGNVADPVTVSNINIDKTPPKVMITLPGTGEYVLNQSVTATWSATDALSGVVSPVSGSVSINTSSVGTKTFTLPAGTALDKAGNSSLKVTKSYSVIADTEDPEMIYPQKWATGDGTENNPWVNNCIKQAYDACPTGGTIFLKAGYYILSEKLTIDKQINIIGEGIGKTIIVTANAYGFSIKNTDYVTLKEATVDGAAQTDGIKYLTCIAIDNCNYVSLEDIEVKNAGYYGINLYEVNHSLLQNIYTYDNYRHGVHAGSDTAGRNVYNTYRNIDAWDNGVDGFDDRGNGEAGLPIEECYNVYDNIRAWGNAGYGILVWHQKNANISNCYANDNSLTGFGFTSLEDSNINDCFATLNCPGSTDHYGIYISDSENVNITNAIVKNNGSGIRIKYGNNIALTSCQSYDDRDILTQRFGLELTHTNTGISLLNCKLTPNELGDIYNPNGIAIKAITEKMLAKF